MSRVPSENGGIPSSLPFRGERWGDCDVCSTARCTCSSSKSATSCSLHCSVFVHSHSSFLLSIWDSFVCYFIICSRFLHTFFHSSRLGARLKRVRWISKFADRIENIKYIFQSVPRNLLSREVDNSTNIYLHCSSLNKLFRRLALLLTCIRISHSWKTEVEKGEQRRKSSHSVLLQREWIIRSLAAFSELNAIPKAFSGKRAHVHHSLDSRFSRCPFIKSDSNRCSGASEGRKSNAHVSEFRWMKTENRWCMRKIICCNRLLLSLAPLFSTIVFIVSSISGNYSWAKITLLMRSER